MKLLLLSFFVVLLNLNAFSQNNQDIIGTWKFEKVTTTNPKCKDVSYFPINSFKFEQNNNAEFQSVEGIAKSTYKINNQSIELTNLTENGVKIEGSVDFKLKKLTNQELILLVEYECGSIEIVFKKMK
jgi:hypothetical protein